jgi:hypothetical protein
VPVVVIPVNTLVFVMGSLMSLMKWQWALHWILEGGIIEEARQVAQPLKGIVVRSFDLKLLSRQFNRVSQTSGRSENYRKCG